MRRRKERGGGSGSGQRPGGPTGARIDPEELTNLTEDYGRYLDRLRTYGPARRPGPA